MKTVVAAALGECAHVAGVMNFLRLAEQAGWRTVFLGPAVPVSKVLDAARREEAELVAVSYRLTPENGERLLGEFAEEADALYRAGVRFAFGGTPPVAERARSEAPHCGARYSILQFDCSPPERPILGAHRGTMTPELPRPSPGGKSTSYREVLP